MGEEALDPEQAQYPRVGECQDREAGVRGLVSMGRGNGIGGFRAETRRKGNI